MKPKPQLFILFAVFATAIFVFYRLQNRHYAKNPTIETRTLIHDRVDTERTRVMAFKEGGQENYAFGSGDVKSNFSTNYNVQHTGVKDKTYTFKNMINSTPVTQIFSTKTENISIHEQELEHSVNITSRNHTSVDIKPKWTTKLDTNTDLDYILSGSDLESYFDFISSERMYQHYQNFTNNPDTSKFQRHSLNAEKSRQIPLNRTIKDTRNQQCINKYANTSDYIHKYGNTSTQNAGLNWQYKKVSIVIPFHNEEYSIFLRGLHSVYNRTPQELIHEVILVDDHSSFPNMLVSFEKYIRNFPRLKLYRTKRREGLIRSRLLGAMMSTGDVLVFLDAHIECQHTWIEPLLDIINHQTKAIAIPTVDVIDTSSIDYDYWTSPQYGTFSWELDFVWKNIPLDEQPTDGISPIKSATMIGCAMALLRDTFFSLGAYDENMYIWGGENLELSFRIWMCGEGLFISPCSHVGHIFRAVLPYVFPTGGGIINKNLQRLAETWMDEYKQFYYLTAGHVYPLTAEENSTLISRMNFMKSLKCKSFSWYLSNIAKGIDPPTNSSKLFGEIKNLKSSLCLFYDGKKLQYEDCSRLHTNQTFIFTNSGQIIHFQSQKCLSLDLLDQTSLLILTCQPSANHQSWIFDPLVSGDLRKFLYGVDTRRPFGMFRLQHGNYSLCFTGGNNVQAKGCANKHEQYWIFTYHVKAT